MAKTLEYLFRDGSGRVVMDAPSDLTITLKESDGKKAVRCDPGHCLFAEAAKREFPGLVEVKFTRYTTRFCWPDHVVRYINSESVKRLIATFDADGTFAPGEYTLLAPPPSQQLGAREARGNPAPRPATKTEGRVARVIGTADLRPSTWTFAKTQRTRKSKTVA